MGAHNGAFQSGKRKMRFGRSDQGSGQGDGLRIALLGKSFDLRTAGIAETQYFCGLVECFTGRIVNRGCQSPILANAFDAQNLAMAAGHQHQQIGKGQIRIDQSRRKRVAFEMIDRDQWLAGGHRQCLAGNQADHHPADQAGTSSGSDRIDIIE